MAIISSVITFFLMLILTKVLGPVAIVIAFFLVMGIHIWYRRRYGRWME